MVPVMYHFSIELVQLESEFEARLATRFFSWILKMYDKEPASIDLGQCNTPKLSSRSFLSRQRL